MGRTRTGQSLSIESGHGQTTVPSNGSFRIQAPHSTQASSASSMMSTPAISASISPQPLQTSKLSLPTSAHMAVTAAESRTKKTSTRSLSIFPRCSVQHHTKANIDWLVNPVRFGHSLGGLCLLTPTCLKTPRLASKRVSHLASSRQAHYDAPRENVTLRGLVWIIGVKSKTSRAFGLDGKFSIGSGRLLLGRL